MEKNTSLSEISSDEFNEIEKLKIKEKDEKTERIKMSYTSYSAYNKCPRKYNIGYNYQFRLPASKVITDGLAAHSILEPITSHLLSK